MSTQRQPLHKLLLRQIQRHVGPLDTIPAEWLTFIEVVNQSYHQADADRALLEHALEVSSQELFERNEQLRRDFLERQQQEAALHKAEEERLQLQEEIIRMQAAALVQLSTPLIPINDDIMVMPLIGGMDTQRIEWVMKALLEGMSKSRAQVAIIDITGVPVVDANVAIGLIHAAQSVQLLGARIVLTGIRPEVAEALVNSGVDMHGIITHSTLQSGIAAALSRPR